MPVNKGLFQTFLKGRSEKDSHRENLSKTRRSTFIIFLDSQASQGKGIDREPAVTLAAVVEQEVILQLSKFAFVHFPLTLVSCFSHVGLCCTPYFYCTPLSSLPLYHSFSQFYCIFSILSFCIVSCISCSFSWYGSRFSLQPIFTFLVMHISLGYLCCSSFLWISRFFIFFIYLLLFQLLITLHLGAHFIQFFCLCFCLLNKFTFILFFLFGPSFPFVAVVLLSSCVAFCTSLLCIQSNVIIVIAGFPLHTILSHGTVAPVVVAPVTFHSLQDFSRFSQMCN